MRRRGVAVLAAAIGLGLASPRVAAEPGGVSWKAPAECPDAAWVETRVSKHLGRKMGDEEHATVTVTRRGRGYRMTVRTRTPGGSGQVSHEHADCAVLADLAALIVAMAVDPNAGGSDPTPDPTPPPSQVDDPELPGAARFARPVVDSALTARRPGAVRDLDLWVRGFVAADHGGLPGVAPGMGVALAATRWPWRLEASAAYLPSKRTHLEEMPQAGGDVTLFVGALRSCFGVLGRPLRWSLCGLVEVGDISATSFGVSRPGSGRFVWLSLGAATSAALRLTQSIYFHIDIQATGNLRRPKFTLPAGLVHQSSALGVRGSGGLELRFR